MQTRRQELYRLKDEVMERLKVAREMGDLSENGAYKYAKFELGNIRRELRRLNHLLEHGKVAHLKSHYDTIEYGATFTLEDEKGEHTFMLVNEHESDPMKQKLSEKSPLGQAVQGKKIHDIVKLDTPVGEKTYRVLHIK